MTEDYCLLETLNDEEHHCQVSPPAPGESFKKPNLTTSLSELSFHCEQELLIHSGNSKLSVLSDTSPSSIVENLRDVSLENCLNNNNKNALQDDDVPTTPLPSRFRIPESHVYILATCIHYLQAAEIQMEGLLVKLKEAVDEAKQGLDEKDSHHHLPVPFHVLSSHEQQPTVKKSKLKSIGRNISQIKSMLLWLPTFMSVIQKDVADTLRKVFFMISKFALTLPTSLQLHIKHFFLSLPSKWASMSFSFTLSSMFQPKNSVDQLNMLTDLVLDTINMLRSIKALITEYLETLDIQLDNLLKDRTIDHPLSASLTTNRIHDNTDVSLLQETNHRNDDDGGGGNSNGL